MITGEWDVRRLVYLKAWHAGWSRRRRVAPITADLFESHTLTMDIRVGKTLSGHLPVVGEGLDGRERGGGGGVVKFEDQEESDDATNEDRNGDYDDEGLVEPDNSHPLVQKGST